MTTEAIATNGHFDLDNVKMIVTLTAPNGVVNHETIFLFSQQGKTFAAHYQGGKILKGFLVGTNHEGILHFTYCQLQVDGQLDHGQSTGTVSISDQGKRVIIERFEWRNGEMGENIFEEV